MNKEGYTNLLMAIFGERISGTASNECIATIDNLLLELSNTNPRFERYVKILRMRYGIGELPSKMTLREVGEQFSVTPERIRQIEAKTLRLLRHPLRSHKLRTFLDEGG